MQPAGSGLVEQRGVAAPLAGIGLRARFEIVVERPEVARGHDPPARGSRAVGAAEMGAGPQGPVRGMVMRPDRAAVIGPARIRPLQDPDTAFEQPGEEFGGVRTVVSLRRQGGGSAGRKSGHGNHEHAGEKQAGESGSRRTSFAIGGIDGCGDSGSRPARGEAAHHGDIGPERRVLVAGTDSSDGGIDLHADPVPVRVTAGDGGSDRGRDRVVVGDQSPALRRLHHVAVAERAQRRQGRPIVGLDAAMGDDRPGQEAAAIPATTAAATAAAVEEAGVTSCRRPGRGRRVAGIAARDVPHRPRRDHRRSRQHRCRPSPARRSRGSCRYRGSRARVCVA